jgi:methionyl-tRNA formyltransferase
MRAIVIGAGKMATDCIQLILKAGLEIPLTITTLADHSFGSSIKKLPAGIELMETKSLKDLKAKIAAVKPDVIFSINNFLIVPDPFFGLAPKGIINFHNAPLPRYAGLNACSWAIINGENEHAVTWHFMTPEIDAGDIILQERFPIEPDDTALTLLMRCILRGTNLFGTLLQKLKAGPMSRTAQDLSKRLYFGKRDIPHEGKADFSWPYQQLHNFVRGLNFHSFPNMFVYPEARVNGKRFVLDRIERLPIIASSAPGRITGITDNDVIVQGSDAMIRLCAVRNWDSKPVSMKEFVETYGIHPGDSIS